MELNQIKGQYDLRELMGGELVLCPFHSERTASCRVRDKSFKCFGCGKSGDIFTLVMHQHGCDFKEALKRLGGGEYKPAIREKINYCAYNAQEIELITTLNQFIYDVARRYKHPYGEERQLVEYGFITRRQSEHLITEIERIYSVSKEDLQRYGLLNSKFSFPFHSRLLIPYYEHFSSRIIGFTSRLIPGYLPPDIEAVLPKYINTTTSPAFGPWYVYNLQSTINHEVYIVEGQIDALSLGRLGMQAVALCTSNSTESKLDSILHYYHDKQINVLLDGDNAGRKGAITLAQELLTRGIYCTVYLLPEGEDPSSLSRDKDKNSFLRKCLSFNSGALMSDTITTKKIKPEYDRSRLDEVFRPFVMDNIKNGWYHLNVLDYVCLAFPEDASDIKTALKLLTTDTLLNEQGKRTFRENNIQALLKAWKKPCKKVREAHGKQQTKRSEG